MSNNFHCVLPGDVLPNTSLFYTVFMLCFQHAADFHIENTQRSELGKVEGKLEALHLYRESMESALRFWDKHVSVMFV